MPEFDDLIAKYILAAALEKEGIAQPEKEVPQLSSQSADFYFEPGPGPRNPSPVFRWLNLITAVPCLLEMYSGTPSLLTVLRGPLRKHLEHFQNRCLEAERMGQVLPGMQAQWILSSGRPEQLLTELSCEAMAGTPTGFYRSLAQALRMHVVVLPELPRGRETLLLRLLGSWPLRLAALAELRQIPGNDPDARALISLLSYVQAIIDRDPRIPRQEKETIMLAMKQEFEKFKQGLRGEGKAEAVIRVLQRRGIALSEEARQQILRCTDQELLNSWLDRAVVATSVDEVLHPLG